VHVVKNIVLGTHENIPETTTTFEDLVSEIENLPASLQTKTFTHENESSPLKQSNEEAPEANWGDDEPENDNAEDHKPEHE